MPPVPIFKTPGGWSFWGLTEILGPYATTERAIEKYEEYRAYVIDAPVCHHATP